jgi:uncharacterized membrane protein
MRQLVRKLNVSLNDALDAFDLRSATSAAIAERRSSYETPWNRWHHLRAAANVAAFALASAAALVAAASDDVRSVTATGRGPWPRSR